MNSSQTQIALLNDLIVNAIKTSVASCLLVNQCKVCNEESDGQTYGIQACKDCDDFFAQSQSKHSDFVCVADNNCVLDIQNRNKCDSCRFNKCISEGMSIKEDSSAIINEIKSVKALQVSNIDRNKCCVLLSLDLLINENADEKKFDFLYQHHLFNSSSLLPTTVFRNDSDFPRIVVVKDKICQIYKEHIKKSNNINNTLERLNSKDYIGSSKDVTKVQLKAGLLDTINEFSKWAKNFINEINGIGSNQINPQDMETIITQANYILNATHFSVFVENGESHAMLANGLQLSRGRLRSLFGKKLTDILFDFLTQYKLLKLSENETALFNAFVLTSCNPDLIIDKNNYIHIQNIFKKALIYEFELNQRDSLFFGRLKELFCICAMIEVNRKKYLMSIQMSK